MCQEAGKLDIELDYDGKVLFDTNKSRITKVDASTNTNSGVINTPDISNHPDDVTNCEIKLPGNNLNNDKVLKPKSNETENNLKYKQSIFRNKSFEERLKHYNELRSKIFNISEIQLKWCET